MLHLRAYTPLDAVDFPVPGRFFIVACVSVFRGIRSARDCRSMLTLCSFGFRFVHSKAGGLIAVWFQFRIYGLYRRFGEYGISREMIFDVESLSWLEKGLGILWILISDELFRCYEYFICFIKEEVLGQCWTYSKVFIGLFRSECLKKNQADCNSKQL